MGGLYRLARPLLFRLEAERAHAWTLAALKSGLAPSATTTPDPVLKQSLWGLEFANPVGLAAGFDKNAEVMAATLGLGFGFVEVGSLTPVPQSGNPRPRVFRLAEDRAIINRLGFNNEGHAAARTRLELFRRTRTGIVGVNLGKNKEQKDAAADYAEGARQFAALADYLVINVSSPNTPGLRALQGRQELTEILGRVNEALQSVDRRPPLLLKIAPDLATADLEDIAAVALESAIGGIIATNTTIARPDSLRSSSRGELGGLSGCPLFEPSTDVLSRVYRLTEGRVPLIGVGGVDSGISAYRKIRAGASLVELYTGLVYEGPGLAGRIADELATALKRDGFSSIADAVGADVKDD